MNRAHSLLSPPKLSPGDQVAVVSPSWAGAGVFPQVHDIGVSVLRDEFGLVPIEYPTTRLVGATPAERARDLNAAFADPNIKALMAVIGGSDQITVLPHLDAQLIASNPKACLLYTSQQ